MGLYATLASVTSGYKYFWKHVEIMPVLFIKNKSLQRVECPSESTAQGLTFYTHDGFLVSGLFLQSITKPKWSPSACCLVLDTAWVTEKSVSKCPSHRREDNYRLCWKLRGEELNSCFQMVKHGGKEPVSVEGKLAVRDHPWKDVITCVIAGSIWESGCRGRRSSDSGG